MASNEQPSIKLFWLDKSRSQRILWLLEELKLPYEIEIFHRSKETKLAPPELKKVHPLGKSPVIQITPAGAGPGTQPITLAESGFITQYLAENVPEGSKLVPQRWREGMEGKIGGETEAWMRYQYYLHYCEGSFMPFLVMSMVVGGLRSPMVPFFIRPISSMLANRIFAMFIFPNIRNNLELIEGHLTTPGGGYICGDRLTAADILMSFPLIASQESLDGLGTFEGGSWRNQFPKVAEYIKRLEAEEGYKKSVEKIIELDGEFRASLCSSQLRSASASASAKQLGATASYATRPASTSAGTRNESTARHAAPRRGVDAFRVQESHRQQNDSDQDPALALFNEIVNPKDNPAPRNTKPARTSIPILSELEIAARLKEIMARGLHQVEQYKIFDNEIWPSIQKLGGQIPKPILMFTAQLLRSQHDFMVHKGMYVGSLELAEKYSAIGNYDLDIRNHLILNICAKTSLEKNRYFIRTQLKEELVKMWMHVSQLKRPGEVNKKLQFALPSAAEVMKDAKYAEGHSAPFKGSPTSRALASMLLQFPPPQALAILPGLMASLAVLSDRRFAGPTHRQLAAPMLLLVRSVLFKYELKETDIDFIFSQPSNLQRWRHTQLKEYVLNQFPSTIAMLTSEVVPWADPPSKGQGLKMNNSLNLFHRQLRSAYRGRNTGAIATIWDSMMESLDNDPDLKVQLTEDKDLLDYWIFVWCATRRTDRIQDTLELMRSLGVESTVRTYTSMMHGWKKCKDVVRIEALWDQLIQSGTKLDMFIWTERISALIDLGQHQKGLQALTELVSSWQEAVKKGTQAQAVEPSIEAVNAAFKGLLNTDPKAAHKLLEWAARNGLEPNTRTYNILVRETLRMGHTDGAHEILRKMEKQGIEPDSATFTILLEAVIGNMEESTAEQQVHAVHTVFDEIEQAGLKPNLETYGKVLYALDGLPNCSDDVVAAVQRHMQSKGFGAVLTPHMITILIERALRRDPPDINKVRSLLKENKLTKVNSGDQTLWERVMTAHAIGGDIKEAMGIFDELAKSDRPVTSLPCLKELMQALLEHGDMESARRVVNVVLTHELNNKESKSTNDRYWRHQFWFLARDNGLIDNHTLKLQGGL
ncbi:hypothetical protein F66182_4590 [Fusarium sp. NRRL 66182]|nr:hypothetical protein F66182_4590 [Fusarium sp. NRRL 66182]